MSQDVGKLMCWIAQIPLYLRKFIYSGTCLIHHTNRPGKYVGLYRMSEYSAFISININTWGPYIFVRSWDVNRMSENSGVGLHKFHCSWENSHTCIKQIIYQRWKCSLMKKEETLYTVPNTSSFFNCLVQAWHIFFLNI